MNIDICPECKTKPVKDNAHRRTCRNDKCKIGMVTYLHHEWYALHEAKKAPQLTIDGQINELMKGFA